MTTAAIKHTRSAAFLDTRRYVTSDASDFAADATIQAASFADYAELATSPNWEDRVRADVLRQQLQPTLPPQFPCIYERADSPSQARLQRPRDYAWVTSPSIEMLEEVLPTYQELWDSYTAQWGPGSRRVFAVGRLDGLSPSGVYRPDATPAHVIAQTLLTHTDMMRNAPKHIRAMWDSLRNPIA